MAKTFRIFLSSTFGDFQAEREALKAKVWSKLEDRCRFHGAAFEVVDLRWGVSEADGLSHDTLRICLDEVAACRLLSPRPNFMMLIGDRYGWRPLPADIPADEFETLLAVVSNEDDRKLMQDWYHRDDNLVNVWSDLREVDFDQFIIGAITRSVVTVMFNRAIS